MTLGRGRPKKRKADAVTHQARPWLAEQTALHVTLKLRASVPNLRDRKRFAAVRAAFVKFCNVPGSGFRLVHFSVQTNHIHLIAEADSKLALSKGMQRVAHSISRRVNALAERWIGRIFKERYHAHVLMTSTEMVNAVRYVRDNHAHHTGGARSDAAADEYSSFVPPAEGQQEMGVVRALGFLLLRACEGR